MPPERKRDLLTTLLRDPSFERVLVFTRTKHGADRVVRHLCSAPGIDAAAIHGNKSQPQRERALAGFRNGDGRVLVATDIAARGIDVEDVTHVINFELPNVPEDYVHRIGRTARAGAAGIAIAFCSDEERPYLRSIEKLTRLSVPVLPMPSGVRSSTRSQLRRSPSAGSRGQTGRTGCARVSARRNATTKTAVGPRDAKSRQSRGALGSLVDNCPAFLHRASSCKAAGAGTSGTRVRQKQSDRQDAGARRRRNGSLRSQMSDLLSGTKPFQDTDSGPQPGSDCDIIRRIFRHLCRDVLLVSACRYGSHRRCCSSPPAFSSASSLSSMIAGTVRFSARAGRIMSWAAYAA